MVKVLMGEVEGRVSLFNSFIDRLVSGGTLASNEVSVFETLKKEFIRNYTGTIPEEPPIEPEGE
jgi:hypothetical protein